MKGVETDSVSPPSPRMDMPNMEFNGYDYSAHSPPVMTPPTFTAAATTQQPDNHTVPPIVLSQYPSFAPGVLQLSTSQKLALGGRRLRGLPATTSSSSGSGSASTSEYSDAVYPSSKQSSGTQLEYRTANIARSQAAGSEFTSAYRCSPSLQNQQTRSDARLNLRCSQGSSPFQSDLLPAQSTSSYQSSIPTPSSYFSHSRSVHSTYLSRQGEGSQAEAGRNLSADSTSPSSKGVAVSSRISSPSAIKILNSFQYDARITQPNPESCFPGMDSLRSRKSIGRLNRVPMPREEEQPSFGVSAADRARVELSFAAGQASLLEKSAPINYTGEVKEDPPGDRTEADDMFRGFVNWLVVNGAEFPELCLKAYHDDMRGVHCKRFVDSYQTIVTIPLRCIITDYMGRTETTYGRRVFSTNCSLSTPNLIAVVLYILSSREDPDHFFQPYYRILPTCYSDFPIFWTASKLSWLKGSPLLDDIEERKRTMRADYDELCRVCPELSRYSFNDFLEVRTAVGSRNFGIVINGEKRTAMVPFADMLNHYRPRETSWTFENSKNAFTITSLTPLQPGQQVMDSYGKKCNSKFFLHYGFAVERNREEDGRCQNELFFRFRIRSTNLMVHDPPLDRVSHSSLESGTRENSVQPTQVEQKIALLSNLFNLSLRNGQYISKSFRLSMNYEDKSTSDALSFLRMKVADEKELEAVVSATAYTSRDRLTRLYMTKTKEACVSFVSPVNEAKVLEEIAIHCTHQLRGYAASYEANVAALSSGLVQPFTDRRTALVVVVGEQEICHFWIYVAQQLCPILRQQDPPCPGLAETTRKSPAFPLVLSGEQHMTGSEELCQMLQALRLLPGTTDRERDMRRYAKYISEQVQLQHRVRYQ